MATIAVCHAQQATLPHNGRQSERGPAPATEPIRKLPRRTAAPVITPRETLQQYIEEHRRERPRVFDRRESPVGESAIRVLPREPLLSAAAPPPAARVAAESIPNRWKIFPAPPWRRYDDRRLDAIYPTSRRFDPFNRNVMKADFPIAGRRLFFDFSGASETLIETRRVPVPEGASTAEPGTGGFFGRGEQFAASTRFRRAIRCGHRRRRSHRAHQHLTRVL
jgi:hypothetical protein